jgi:hypothetical protein
MVARVAFDRSKSADGTGVQRAETNTIALLDDDDSNPSARRKRIVVLPRKFAGWSFITLR